MFDSPRLLTSRPLRLLVRIVGEILLFSAAMMTAVLNLGLASERYEPYIGVFAPLVGLIFSFMVPAALLWRRRAPVQIATALGIIEIVLPIGPVMGFALPQALRVGSAGERRKLVLLYLVGALVGVWHDLADTSGQTSVLCTLLKPAGGNPRPVSENTAGIIVIVALTIAVPIVAGFLFASRDQVRTARAGEARQQRRSGVLADELSRKDERELLAREIHDVLGHRLSLMAVHAGALRAMAADQPALVESANQVQSAAQESIDDLRSLISMMREPGAAIAKHTSFADLQQVIDDALDAGQRCGVTVRINEQTPIAAEIVHTVYRAVQELLTNARKHANDTYLRLSVVGNEAEGITITASNPLLSAALSGEGTGLRAMRTRVDALDGEMRVQRSDGHFTVTITLPWARPTQGDPA